MRGFLLCLALLAAALPARASQHLQEVDLELLLMVDVSRSMSPDELEIQRRGYATALRSQGVFEAVQSGMLGKVALAYVEWAGSQNVIIDWRVVASREDLEAFADELTATFNPALRRTSISGALVFGQRMIEDNDLQGLRRVIDVSGDGPNNFGRPVLVARRDTVEAGITINGLPLMTRDEWGSQWHLDGLDIYYRTCVIGGPGAFLIPVTGWEEFAVAVRRKLILEIADLPGPPPVIRAQGRSWHDPTDCMIGEKIWAERQRIFGTP